MPAVVMLLLSSCHDTIHMHPWEEDEPAEEVELLLKLHIDNSPPQLGAIIDYTVYPPVIIFSDDLPAEATSRAHRAETTSGGCERDGRSDAALMQRAYALSDAFNEIAPYALDGDKWELHLKYEVYAATADQVNRGLVAPVHAGDVTYRADMYQPVHDEVIRVRPGAVTIVAVGHIVPAGTTGDWFYNTATLNNIVCNIEKRQGEHDNVYRDCFVVGCELYVKSAVATGEMQCLSATLTRPQGRYMVIADDYEAYLDLAGVDIENTSSHIHYPSYINVAYSALAGKPTMSSYNFGYDFRPSLTQAGGGPYVRLGDDWSFVNGERSNFNIDITVRDTETDGDISGNTGTLVPVFPGRVTLVVGHWLTSTVEGSGGGVVIDPGFTDEIILHF